MSLSFNVYVKSKTNQKISNKPFELFIDGIMFNYRGKEYRLLVGDECFLACFSENELHRYFDSKKQIPESDTVKFIFDVNRADFYSYIVDDEILEELDITYQDVFSKEEFETHTINDDDFEIFELIASLNPLFSNCEEDYEVTITDVRFVNDEGFVVSDKIHHVYLT